MRQSYGAIITGTLAAACAAAAVYGMIVGNELMIGLGACLGFVFLLLLPAFLLRAAKIKKLLARQDALAIWEYSAEEADEIAMIQRKVIRKSSRGLALLICICLIIIFLPFVVLSNQEGSELPPMLPIVIPVVLLPWLSVFLAPAAAANKIRSHPCLSVIGRDYIFVANRYLGVNDRYALTAAELKYEPPKRGGMAMLHTRYQFKAGRTTRLLSHWVDVPVPRGKEAEAMSLRLQDSAAV